MTADSTDCRNLPCRLDRTYLVAEAERATSLSAQLHTNFATVSSADAIVAADAAAIIFKLQLYAAGHFESTPVYC